MESLEKTEHLNIGKNGELLAEKYLNQLGYIILERNWIFRHKELDIIAIDRNELVIAEVKTRSEPTLDFPDLAVNRKKQKNIVSAANAYVRYNRISLDVRFDIIWILVDKRGKATIEHFRDAFIPCL
jgi:putative endonuclease